MKNFICSGILALMAVLTTVPAYAYAGTESAGTHGVITPQYTCISLLNAGLTINSSGKAGCTGLASAYNSSQTTKLTVQLQKSTSSGWSTIKSWSASSTGVSVAAVEQSYYVANGIYRVRATANVYNSSGKLLESKSLYSSTVSY